MSERNGHGEEGGGGERGFQVKDRRRFNPDGSPREEGAAGETGGGPSAAPEGASGGEGAPATEAGLPPIDFSTFVLSLSTSALVHLGDVPGPDGKADKNLPLARQTIDILAMLKEKTEGNLTAEESRTLDNLLYDLRLRYVKVAG